MQTDAPPAAASTVEDLVERTADQRTATDQSVTGVLREFAAHGFSSSFRPAREPVEGAPAVVCGACGHSSRAHDLDVTEERRLEGASDPADMVLVVAAVCPACGAAGAIVLGYGPEASPEDGDLVLALQAPDGPEEVSDPGGDSDPGTREGSEVPEPGRSGDDDPGDSGDGGPSGMGRIGAALDRAAPLDRVADPVERTIVDQVPASLREVLQGRWLGHPLHPVLTDLPIGFWTSAWVLDLVGGERSEVAADGLVAAGVVCAVPTVWAGWADWTELPRDKRRSGLVHAAAGSTAAALYAASFVLRRAGNRRGGILLGHLGAGAATVGGFLGGHLAFGD